tara:strand:- start:1721 stop:1870 length:150 start_codon:yes stop_codon:yes gene_type:complete
MGFILVFTLLAAWFTHVIHCFIDESWGLLIAGAVMAPIAIINGFYIWFT